MNRIPGACRLGLLPALAAVLLVACRPVIRPAPRPGVAQTITVLYAGDIDWTRLPELATLVRTEKPALSIVDGEILGQGPVTWLFQGRAECEALAGAGIDAVRMTPAFLSLGTRTARQLADSVLPPAFLLGADVLDTTRQPAFGAPFLRKTSATGNGSLRLGLIGLAGDQDNLFWRQAGISQESPDSAFRRLVPVLKMTSDLVGVAVNPATPDIACPGADFVIGSRAAPLPASGTAMNRLELELDVQHRVIRTRVTTLDLTRVKPDSTVARIINRYRHQADSLLKRRINDAKVELDVKTLTQMALKTAPSRVHAEGALFGNSLSLKPLPTGEITLALLFDITGPGNRLLKLGIEGLEFEQGLTRGEPGVEWRSILKHQRIMLHRQYDIVTTMDYVLAHPLLLQRRLDFQPVSLAEIYAFALRDRGRARPDTLE